MSALFYYLKEGTAEGPVLISDLLKVASVDTLIREEGSSGDWIAIKDSPILMAALSKLNDGTNTPSTKKESFSKKPPPLPGVIETEAKREIENKQKNSKDTRSAHKPFNALKGVKPNDVRNQTHSTKAIESKNQGGCGLIIILIVLLVLAGALYLYFENTSASPSVYDNANQEYLKKKKKKIKVIDNSALDRGAENEAPRTPTFQQCINCNGTGMTSKECGWCEGSGMNIPRTADCSWCNGRGYNKETCNACDGEKRVRTN